ncbi:MAG: LamG-like jellyroll fold domain-containing protein, partial [Roseibacillus sp.]
VNITPIVGATDLTASGAGGPQHQDTSWNTRTYADYNFASGGWFHAEVLMTEDGGGAQSAGGIGFGYLNGPSTGNDTDFGIIGAPGGAVFDVDANGQSFGSILEDSNPNPGPDSDGDGLPNAWEIQHNLDPNDNGDVDPVNGAAGDPDADTLSNLEEFNRGTDPRDDDSDDDNLGDLVEDNTGIYVSPTQTGSNPLDPDSDGDGLEDGAEVEANPFVTDPNNADTDGDSLDDASEEAANPFVTDPTKEDTDGDGFSDSAEINLGSDPTDENDFPTVGGGTIISVNIAGGNQNAPGVGGGGGEGIVTGNAGLGQLGNWNNAIGTDGTLTNVVNANGVPSGASFTWVTNNTWSTSTADGVGTDADMMSGYIDNFHANGSIVVSGLGAEFTGPGYDVLVYYQNDNDVNTAGFTATDNQANTDTRYGHQLTANNNYPLPGGVDGYVISTETDPGTTFSANVVKLTGLRGSEFTLTGNAGTGQPSIRARPNAIQIVTEGVAVDSDGDGLPNGWETDNNLDPNDNGDVDPDNGASGDPDGDDLTNLEEFNRGTDPQDSDSDDDGVSDGDEVNVHMTDPREADSDGDGRTDGEEVNGNPTSDPADPDTDDDGFKDGAEVLAGTDPNDPDSKPELLPIGYWSFDDQGAGGTTADLSPGGNDGTLNGNPEIVPGACGEDGDFAFKFDGIDDFIGTGASLLTGLDEYTMSGWVKFDTPQLVNRIGWFGQNDAVEFGLINPAQLQHWTVVGGALNIAVADTAPWTHVLVTGDATGRTVYLDGVQAGSGPSSLGSGSAFPFNIGGGGIYDATGNFFTGCIDEVAVWDMVLTQELITQLANCETTPIGPRAGGINRLGLNVRRTEAGMLEISWNSKEGELYNLRSETGLSTEPLTWAIFDGNDNLAATPPRNTLTFPYPADPERFFAIEGFPKPPVVLFEDNFDGRNDLAPWTNSSPDGNPWELGVPTALLGPPTAFSAPNAVGTVLAGNYIASDALDTFVVSTLRSPAISLSGIVSGTISYQRYVDMEDPQFDFATVNLLDAADDSLIEVLEPDI